MNIVKINNVPFNMHSYFLSGNGLNLTLLTTDIEAVEQATDNEDGIIEIFAGEDSLMAHYAGYTTIHSIVKTYDFVIDEEGNTATAITVELHRPTLEDMISANRRDITDIQEGMAEVFELLLSELTPEEE